MKNRDKKTNLFGSSLSLAVLSCLAANISFGEGVVNVTDYESQTEAISSLSQTTLDKLNATNSNIAPSSISLDDVTDSISKSDLDENGKYTGSEYSFVVKKYLIDENGEYKVRYFALTVDTIGSGDNTIYYKWDSSSSSDYDFIVKYNGDKTYTIPDQLNDRLENTSTTATDITDDYIGLSQSFSDDTASSTSTYLYALGGAIYNDTSAKIGDIDADFKANTVSADNSNSDYHAYSYAQGGAIYNLGDIESITGDFVDNKASANAESSYSTATAYPVAYAQGGAIYNYTPASQTMTIGDIYANFINNTATATTDSSESTYTSNGTNVYGGKSYAYGGAIYNYAYAGSSSTASTITIGDISGDFVGNSAVAHSVSSSDYYGTTEAAGGAIFNKAQYSKMSIDSISGNFIDNYAQSDDVAYGGAIYNCAYRTTNFSIDLISGNFIGNYAKSTYDVARGGAIYNYVYGGTSTSSSSKITIDSIAANFYTNYVYSSSDYAQGGAISNYLYSKYAYLEISDITGDFVGNYAYSGSSYASGGAIFNSIASYCDLVIESITGDFIGNYVQTDSGTSYAAQGGAIYNSGSSTTYTSEITLITGDFLGNYGLAETGKVYGGAIYNTSVIGQIDGDFISNYADGYTTYGGAIYMTGNSATITTINGDFVDNYATGYNADGGAIYLGASSSITTINGDFIDNYAYAQTSSDARGGAIYANSASIDVLNSSFTNNSIEAKEGDAFGGAIYYINEDITSILGNFTNNSAIAESSAYGGAIFFEQGEIGSIDGDFTNNSATGSSAYGGAIANCNTSNTVSVATLSDIDSNFSNNSASATSGDAQGGAIYNYALGQNDAVNSTVEITSLIGDFSNNSATSDEATAQGGAIYNVAYASLKGYTNTASIESLEGSFTNNYVKGVTAQGGAVYNENASITFTASKDTNYYYLGNYATTDNVIDENDDQNGGFMYISDATATFNTAENSSIIIGDGSAGYDSIAGDGIIIKEGVGSLTINSSMADYFGTLNVTGGNMAVNNGLGASVISISQLSTLSINIIGNNTLSNEDLTITNNGTLKLIASVGLTESTQYTIATNSALDFDSDSINAIAYGGTISDNTFTTSAIQTGISVDGIGENAISVTSNDIITIESSTSDAAIVMSFNSSSATVSAVTNDADSDFNSLVADIYGDSEIICAAYSFTVTMTDGDSVVLSFLVGEGYDLSEFTIFHKDDDSTWEIASEISDLSYEDGYLSFIVDSFSSYGYATVVPEPSTYAIIFGSIALGLAIYRRRK